MFGVGFSSVNQLLSSAVRTQWDSFTQSLNSRYESVREEAANLGSAVLPTVQKCYSAIGQHLSDGVASLQDRISQLDEETVKTYGAIAIAAATTLAAIYVTRRIFQKPQTKEVEFEPNSPKNPFQLPAVPASSEPEASEQKQPVVQEAVDVEAFAGLADLFEETLPAAPARDETQSPRHEPVEQKAAQKPADKDAIPVAVAVFASPDDDLNLDHSQIDLSLTEAEEDTDSDDDDVKTPRAHLSSVPNALPEAATLELLQFPPKPKAGDIPSELPLPVFSAGSAVASAPVRALTQEEQEARILTFQDIIRRISEDKPASLNDILEPYKPLQPLSYEEQRNFCEKVCKLGYSAEVLKNTGFFNDFLKA